LLATQVAKDVQIEEGSSKVSGTVYFAGDELRALLSNTYAAFSHTNPLHGDVFPSVRRMEAEVVTMVAAMLGGECTSQS
jgi:sphinganine-1-phosphate aldolase